MKALKNTLIFLSGAGAGVLGTWLYLKERYLARADAEIEDMRLHYEAKLEDLKEMERDILLTADLKEENKEIISENGYENDQNSIENPVISEDIVKKARKKSKKAVREDPIDIPAPHIISFDEYTDDTSYEKCILSYFEEDEVVMDNNEEVVTDAFNILGKDNLEQFGMVYGDFDDDTLYIRNELLGFDYEVVREGGSYENFVKNCGN